MTSSSTRAIILIVDDNLEVLHALRRQLRMALGGRARIVVVNQPDHALERLSELASDQLARTMVILDFRLPGMEGDTFVRALAEQHGPVPVVFLSGHISAEAKAAMETEPQVRAILPKPWDEEQLLAILTEIIDAFPTLS